MIRKCLRIALGGLLVSAAFVFPACAQSPLADRAVLTRFHSPTFGDPAAKVEIVEFFDPACEACRAMHPFVKKLLEEHVLRSGMKISAWVVLALNEWAGLTK